MRSIPSRVNPVIASELIAVRGPLRAQCRGSVDDATCSVSDLTQRHPEELDPKVARRDRLRGRALPRHLCPRSVLRGRNRPAEGMR
eukprot:CAMPEP_0181214684 /NCGR_PEP_ID=MMETSP1096-20121128/25594_1 /TAXON_ID=156174 ORGANISM="Chrysochromulina ericina, Strain CCMP281" /NCGR_SAMPLE_ID=MMETSP1096 /ASSEMBLY_ACC=CAM_ASM_000453 /LENGTH=85 /DNA_ID=CAMNT_0023306455 /DNA_START=241 /DNA_END=495 /DNA_ORIENTATION=+